MRLFAAVFPPSDAVGELAHALVPLGRLPGAEALRWTGRDTWHFTLAFYGEADEEETADLTARLARAARRCAPVPLRLGGGGRFGDRALWAGLAPDSGRTGLMRLARSATAAGRRAGLVPEEDRPRFRPHLTVARSRGLVDLRPYVDELQCFQGSLWTAGELVLVHSVPPPGGVPGARPRYEALERWALEG
ncbi:RNA 2',3'-cyclic phosphodiesterase [Streptomyces cacaoi]